MQARASGARCKRVGACVVLHVRTHVLQVVTQGRGRECRARVCSATLCGACAGSCRACGRSVAAGLPVVPLKVLGTCLVRCARPPAAVRTACWRTLAAAPPRLRPPACLPCHGSLPLAAATCPQILPWNFPREYLV